MNMEKHSKHNLSIHPLPVGHKHLEMLSEDQQHVFEDCLAHAHSLVLMDNGDVFPDFLRTPRKYQFWMQSKVDPEHCL